MPFNSGAGEDSWNSLGQQRDQTSQPQGRSTMSIHCKDWCWSWSSGILVIWYEQTTHWKSPLCWERLRAEGEEDEMAGWRHQCNEYELGQILGDGEGQGGLECCSPWRAESRTQLGNWTTTAIHSYAFSYFMIFLIGNDHIFKQASTRSYAPGRGDLKIHPRMEQQVWSRGKMQDTFETQFRLGIWGPWNVVLSEISTQRSTWSSSGLKAIWSCSRHKSDKASQHGAQLSPAK